MNLIVLPPQTLRDPNSSPFLFGQDTKHARVVRIKKRFRYEFEERFGENDMTIFEFIICVLVGIVNSDRVPRFQILIREKEV